MEHNIYIMIIGIWKKIEKSVNKKKTIIRFDKAYEEDLYKAGSSMLRITYKCDCLGCKNPNRVYSIQRHHLKSKTLNEERQICKSCQNIGYNNPRFGDNRNFNEIHGKEKAEILKADLGKKWVGLLNPSKLSSVKEKKGQMVINFENVYNKAKKIGYTLLNMNGYNKFSRIEIKCQNGHISEIEYSNLRNNHNCRWCYYDSIKLNLDEETIKEYENYKKVIRYNVRSTYKKYKNLIDPLNFKSNPKEYHIDHIYSISEGFRNNIDPKIISSPVNLRVIKNCDNLLKGSKCDITIEELIGNYNIFIRSTM